MRRPVAFYAPLKPPERSEPPDWLENPQTVEPAFA